jgi:hypothetical protein
LKVVTTTRFSERTFYKGLLFVRSETKEAEKSQYLLSNDSWDYDVISVDSKVPLVNTSRINGCQSAHLEGREYDTGEYDGLQWERITVTHCRYHM